MPCEPVLRGPLPLPTLPASSSRAFLSGGCVSLFCVGSLVCDNVAQGAVDKVVRTSSKLGLVGEIVLVELLRLLLGLLVVDGVCTGCAELALFSATMHLPRLMREYGDDVPPCPEGMLAICVVLLGAEEGSGLLEFRWRRG